MNGFRYSFEDEIEVREAVLLSHLDKVNELSLLFMCRVGRD